MMSLHLNQCKFKSRKENKTKDARIAVVNNWTIFGQQQATERVKCEEITSELCWDEEKLKRQRTATSTGREKNK